MYFVQFVDVAIVVSAHGITQTKNVIVHAIVFADFPVG